MHSEQDRSAFTASDSWGPQSHSVTSGRRVSGVFTVEAAP
jgi:hypothetical protein